MLEETEKDYIDKLMEEATGTIKPVTINGIEYFIMVTPEETTKYVKPDGYITGNLKFTINSHEYGTVSIPVYKDKDK